MPPTLPETMRCIEISEPGAPDVLKPATRPLPRPGQGEVLIRVAAAGVNRPDVFQRQGNYPAPPGASDLPGLEVAGTVVALGEGAESLHAEGETVCALLTGGGYAQYAVAPAAQCLPVPAGLSPVEAAALPETFFTVWHNLYDRGRLGRGETLLVHGGTSGIGTTAIQVATRLGAKVIATAGSPEKCAACRDLGAALAIDYKQEDFVAKAVEFTEGRGVDVILDMVGGEYIPRNIKVLATEGRMVSIAFLWGPKVTVNFMPVMLKRLTLTGSTLRAQSVAAKAGIAASLRKHVWPLIEDGSVRPVIHATFPLEEAAAAHRLMEGGMHIGKIVLEVG